MLVTHTALAPPALFLPLGPSSWRTSQLPLADEVSTRTLLVGPPQSGKTSLLLQFAYERARRGLTTLFVCHSREKLWAQRPARPRSGDDDEADTHNLGVLRRVQIKYIRSDRELRDLLVSFHLGGDEVPHTLIIDDLPAIISDPSSRPDATSPHGATQGSPAGPSPSKQAACANMHLALAAGLAAHAADFIDAKYGSPSGGGGGGGGGGIAAGGLGDAQAARAGGVLLVSCTAPTADTVQLLSRWLPAQLRVARAASHGLAAHGMPGTQRHAAYTLSAAHALAPPDAFEPLTQRSLAPAQAPVHYSLAEGRLVSVEAHAHVLVGSHATVCTGMEPPRTPVHSTRPPNAYTLRDVCPQPEQFEQ